jgi:hypothetical protein
MKPEHARRVAALLGLLLAAAGTDAVAKSKKQLQYEATLALWIGRSVEELMVSYGAPKGSTDLPSGGTLMSFEGVHTVGPSDLGEKLWGKKGAVLDSDESTDYRCIVNFAVGKDGLIKAAKVQLNEGLWMLDPCGKLIKAP